MIGKEKGANPLGSERTRRRVGKGLSEKMCLGRVGRGECGAESGAYLVHDTVGERVFEINATGCLSPFESNCVRTAPVAYFDASDSI